VASAFYTIYGMKKFGIGGSTVAGFMVALVVARSFGSLLLGYIGDYRGHVTALRISSLSGILSIVTAVLAVSLWHMVVVFVFLSSPTAIHGIVDAGVRAGLGPWTRGEKRR